MGSGGLDIRMPMGLMFAILGAIITGYGVITNGNDMYARSLGININLVWGLVLLLFGVLMLLMGISAQRKH
jgi:hypothetical protein